MATHDYNIANASGASVRQDINNALAAIVSNNSNPTTPATTYAYQWWADTTTGQLKLRNSDNDGWITIFELDGTMLMEDGTVSAPGLAFASDLNTGFFRSAADKINFATGGAERLEIGSSEVVFNDPSNDVDFRVESNGNANMLFVDAGNDRIGIGTNAPDDVLDVRSGAAGFAQFVHASGNGGIRISGSAASSAANLVFSNDHTSGVSDEYTIQMSGDNDRLAFRSGGPADTERMTLTADGKLGLGATNPAGSLQILGTGDRSLLITGGTSGTNSLQMGDSDDADIGAILYDNSNNSMQFKTNANERARIDSSGRLLVGSSSSRIGGLLQVESTGSGNDRLHSLANNSNDSTSAVLRLVKSRGAAVGAVTSVADDDSLGFLAFTGTDGTGNIDGAYISTVVDGTPGTNNMPTALRFWTNGGAAQPTERVRIDPSGRVGVGLSSNITSLFHVESSFAGTIAEIKNTRGSASTDAGLLVETSTTAAKTLIVKNAGTERFSVQGDGTSYVNGRLGVGASAPSAKLEVGDVAQSGVSTGDLIVDTTSLSADVIVGRLSSTSNDNTTFLVRDRGNNTILYASASGDPFRVGRSGSEFARIDTSGRLLMGLTSSGSGSLIEAKTGAVSSSSSYLGVKAFTANIPYSTSNKTSSMLSGFDGGSIHGVDIGYSYDGSGYYLAFATNLNTSGTPEERMRIRKDGKVFVNNTSLNEEGIFNTYSNGSTPAFQATGGSSMSTSSAVAVFDKHANVTTTSQVFINFRINDQNTGSGRINANGASQAAFGSFSDRRLKENIVDLPSQLDNVCRLRPVEFDYIQSEGGGHQTSFIAQEFEEVFPDAVGEREDGMKTLTGWGKTEAILVKALQEAVAKIEILEAKVAALEAG